MDISNIKPGQLVQAAPFEGVVKDIKWNKEDGSITVIMRPTAVYTDYLSDGRLELKSRKSLSVPLGHVVFVGP